MKDTDTNQRVLGLHAQLGISVNFHGLNGIVFMKSPAR